MLRWQRATRSKLACAFGMEFISKFKTLDLDSTHSTSRLKNCEPKATPGQFAGESIGFPRIFKPAPPLSQGSNKISRDQLVMTPIFAGKTSN